MNEVKINWPAYNAEKAQVLSQHKFALFKAKIKIGAVPVGKFSDAEKTIPLTSPCWNWQAYRGRGGYGTFKFAARKMGLAHRVSAFLAGLTGIKSQSEDDKVLHRCDNPACCNPDHFFIGTNKDNSDDKIAKNRQSKGEENGQSKLTWPEVELIRTRYATGGITTVKLADEYGVTQALICKIISNERWHDPNYTSPTKQVRLPRVYLTAEQRAEAITLYAKGGTTLLKLTKQFGVGQATIHRIIKNNPNYTPLQTRLSQEQRAEVIQLYKQGNTSTIKLGKLYNVDHSTISRIIHKGK